MKKKRFLGQYTFHFFAYYMTEVILTSSLTFFNFPVVHFISRLQRKLILDFSTMNVV